jgi:hypothetical protein
MIMVSPPAGGLSALPSSFMKERVKVTVDVSEFEASTAFKPTPAYTVKTEAQLAFLEGWCCQGALR